MEQLIDDKELRRMKRDHDILRKSDSRKARRKRHKIRAATKDSNQFEVEAKPKRIRYERGTQYHEVKPKRSNRSTIKNDLKREYGV